MSNILNEKLAPYLSTLSEISEEMKTPEGKSYIVPSRKNLGTVTLFLVREIIAPTSFRNQDAENTDILVDGKRVLRAVPLKFKHIEKRKGLEILRKMNAGGSCAQNRTVIQKNQTAGDVFDLNTLIFGDSTLDPLPVKASFMYSDGLSLQSYTDSTDETFHIRLDETGVLYDPIKGKTTNNIYTNYFINPGTIFIQTITMTGKQAFVQSLQHLIASIGKSNSYGGKTSNIGINVKTHIVAISGSNFEMPLSSPYVLLKNLWNVIEEDKLNNIEKVKEELHKIVKANYDVIVDTNEIEELQNKLIESINNNSAETEYKIVQKAVKDLFDCWFKVTKTSSSVKKPGSKDDKNKEESADIESQENEEIEGQEEANKG